MKRWLLKLGVFVLLGAIVNVAMAWGCEMFAPIAHQSNRLPIDYRYREFGRTLRFGVIVKYDDHGHLQSSSWWPEQLEAGWPIRSLSRSIVNHQRVDGISISFGTSDIIAAGTWKRKPALSVRPLWPGFAINTIFYAAVLWLLFAAPGALRRWRRIMRGQCPKCAYPVGSREVCTECGTPLPVAMRRSGSYSLPEETSAPRPVIMSGP